MFIGDLAMDKKSRNTLIKDISKELHKVRHLWYQIGVLLRVPFDDLAAIEDEDHRLREVLTVSSSLNSSPVFVLNNYICKK